ncbi:4'-phosphopantetheinyl transferase superfamily protein [Hymenobacter sp. BT635]|uniref:4'-phosphopantetheinyl transferase superfamily protein n=1 Tax=Hymenobacter nitidus TaxID=2880929 RepID=A0ABS8ABI3_9BACT|nr:4'-phosphopantetheinyl transferase superfamily protein [Hymenobacter nitidus]MCB2376580.1 4'-phosphopantetheinyl transferase superfamily protein [Hymenobacter nitidus]
MLRLLYTNTECLEDNEIAHYLDFLPFAMHGDILRYKFADDQKHRLLARLMLRYCLLETTGSDELMAAWKKDENHKPFVAGWFPFNISHAGKWVIFAYSDEDIGVDIEKQTEVDYQSLIAYFHPDEQAYVRKSEDKQLSFFNIWVKKEAILKAIGTGIVEGWQEFSCIDEIVAYKNEKWLFHPLSIDPGYVSYLCTSENITSIELQEVFASAIATMGHPAAYALKEA